MTNDQLDAQIDFLIKLARTNGSASTVTTDGHLVVLRKDTLVAALENNDNDIVVIFIKSVKVTN